MALTTAQDLLPSELSETDINIKFKCLDCKLLICKKCHEKVHTKFKNAKDHKIVVLNRERHAGSLQSPELNFTTIKCKQHTDQMCCIYCEDCGQLLCPSCLTSCHFGNNKLQHSCYHQHNSE